MSTILCGSLALAACTTLSPSQIGIAVTSAIAAETAASLRCPRTATERNVLLSGRIAFDLRYSDGLSIEQREALNSARRSADIACHL